MSRTVMVVNLLSPLYINIRHPEDMLSERSTIAHLETLAQEHVQAMNSGDFCCNAAIYTARKATGTSSESDKQDVQISCNIIDESPEEDSELQVDVVDMHTTLDSTATSHDRSQLLLTAQTFVTTDRTGNPPGLVKRSVGIVRFQFEDGQWTIMDYERVPCVPLFADWHGFTMLGS